ncbi:MAG: heavy metal translocating P-type ATPase [candidate division Zixibacteria bacterium]|nr:heavy metal translocating P-type ATPase [candidate division Zixibacteria bacterium]
MNRLRRVEQAQSGRVPTNTFVAWFGQRYTIGVLAGATLAVVIPPTLMQIDWSSSFYRSLTLLVVASPCALIISTPAAVLSALGRAARRGVLFKGGSHLITLGKIRAIAFDKTGTLTEGKATVTDIDPIDGANVSEILSLAAAVEAGSTHPLAQAVVDAAHRRNLSLPAVKDSTTHAGLGVSGVAQDGSSGPSRRILVGSRRLFAERQIDVPNRADEILKGFEEQGKTAVLVGTDRVLGVIAIADPPRRTAKAALRDLRQIGARSIGILTGDNQRVAQAMARQLGIDDVQAGLLPEEKADAVAALRRAHGTVAVVGDGINDAPALATASVGIAMGGAKNDVVLETADVVLMSDDLSCLPYAVRLAKRTNRTIVENLTFALVVIALLLVGTFLGRIPLPVGVIGHEGSTLLVVLNSLRLLWYK